MKQPGLDDRSQDMDGEIRHKCRDTLVRTLREDYRPGFAPGRRSDSKLVTVLDKEGVETLSQLLKK